MTNANETFQISVGDELEQVNCFIHLGRKFNQEAGCTYDMKTRLVNQQSR